MSAPLSDRVVGLFRHPVKGFTPEALDAVFLRPGAHFPGDRRFAVEDGPSGFDPAAPAHVSKMRFTVLARLPQIAAIRTRYDDDEDTLTAWHPDFGELRAQMDSEAGRQVFATWLSAVLGDAVRGPLCVLAAPAEHRFMDSRSGFVSIINLASVRDLAERIGRPLDPARFRGNILVDGWPAWAELELAGREIQIGDARLSGLKPITRCAATHVDPATGRADADLVAALFENYGHMDCGLYAEITIGGRVAPGDPAAA